MDISAIAPVERKIAILHPATGEEIGLSFMLMSMEDDRMKRITRRITDKALSLRQRNKSFKAEEIEDNQVDLIIAAVTGWEWSGDGNWNGEQLDFTPANVRKVLKGEMPVCKVIRDQLDKALGDTESFFTA